MYDGISASPARSASSTKRAMVRAIAGLDRGDAPLQVEPEIDGDLFVARPPGVQPPAGVADPRDQFALDEGVHVLVAVSRR